MAPYYYACNVFVLPSINGAESFGQVQLEAMACGKPVISCKIGTGVEYINQQNKTGFLVKPKNSKALAKAINKIINDQELATKLGKNGKKRVDKMFSIGTTARETLKIYHDIIRGGKMKIENNPQVESKHYFNRNYDTLGRFISYFYQIESILKTNSNKILEIGVGNKIVNNYLKNLGLNVECCDFDSNLKPDKVGDIRKLPFKDSQFDTVVAFEVVEHIPFADFEKSLSELYRVSRKNVIISMPYSCMAFEVVTKLSIAYFRPLLRFLFRIPYFFIKIELNEKNKEHYWAMGRKNYPKRRIKKKIRKYFSIIREFQPLLNSQHYFFILEKKNIRGLNNT